MGQGTGQVMTQEVASIGQLTKCAVGDGLRQP